MLPTYKTGDIVIGLKFLSTLKVNNIIILHSPSGNLLIIKRIKEIKGNRYFAVGDNQKESTDSRQFGWVGKSHIVGKVVYKLQ